MDTNKSLPEGYVLTGPVGSYRIVKVLGRGGFGITYLATARYRVNNIVHTVQYAIKEHFIGSLCDRDVTHAVTTGAPSSSTVESSRKDFIGEARRLQNIGNQHRAIVKVNEVFEANNTAYYVMEFLNGESLRKYIERHGALSEDETQRILQPIADAIDYLHRNRLTHLDIKPDNIMLTQEEDEQGNTVIRPVLIDFGLSKHYDKAGYATSTINTLGCSDGYAPVEQYAGIKTFSPKADIYSLAATYLHCLTGKYPPNSTELLTIDVDAMLRGIMPPLSEGLCQRLAASLSPSPAVRCDSLVMKSAQKPQQQNTPRTSATKPAMEVPLDIDAKAIPGAHDVDAGVTVRLDKHVDIMHPETPCTPKPRKSKRLKTILISSAAAIILLAGTWYGFIAYKEARYETVNNAFVDAVNANEFDKAYDNLIELISIEPNSNTFERAAQFMAGAYGNEEWIKENQLSVNEAINYYRSAAYATDDLENRGRLFSQIGDLYAHIGWGIYPPRDISEAYRYYEEAALSGYLPGLLKIAAYSLVCDTTLLADSDEFLTTMVLQNDAANGNTDFPLDAHLQWHDIYLILTGDVPDRFKDAFNNANDYSKDAFFSSANELLGVFLMTQPYARENLGVYDSPQQTGDDKGSPAFDARMKAAEECFKKIDPKWENYADRTPGAIPTLREYRLHQLAEYREKQSK